MRTVTRSWSRHLHAPLIALGVLLAVGASTVWAETITVFAAASLAEAFGAIGRDFQTGAAGTTVELNLAGSSTLARQIAEGARADVFASADPETMQKVVDAGAVSGAPRPFAGNRLAIVVPRGNPRHVHGLADLGRHDMTIALAAPTVPAGRYATEAFRRAGVPEPEASREADVTAVVGRVALGEADAGVAYVTDVAAGGDRVEAVSLPDAHNVTARYVIATLKDAPHPAGAQAFVDHVLSAAGQRVLERAGFLAP